MGIKLVIADDAAFIREAVRNLLEGTDIEIIAEAVNGAEAVVIVDKMKPEVVLMDLIMPEKNGVEAAREILKKNPKMRIVACSTEGQTSLIMSALDAGCCNFISKPFKSEELLKVIRSAGKAR